MTKIDCLKVFKRFRGSHTWAAERLGVSKGTLSKWLWNNGKFPSLDKKFAQVEQLAQQLMESDGSCLTLSARSVVEALRKKDGARCVER